MASYLDFDSANLSKIENDWRQFPENKLSVLAEIIDRPLEEVEEEYINSNIKLKYGHFKNYKEKINKVLKRENEELDILKVIEQGESRLVEFKSSLRYSLDSKKNEKHIEFSVIKNIAAFLNTNGGKLIIGVSDNKEVIGLESTDFLTFKENDKCDEFLKYLDSLIANHFGNNFSRNFDVQFAKVNNKTIAILDIHPNFQNPIIVVNINKNNKEEFYIRRNASAIALTMIEFHSYSKERYK
jgi:hypothetical protein